MFAIKFTAKSFLSVAVVALTVWKKLIGRNISGKLAFFSKYFRNGASCDIFSHGGKIPTEFSTKTFLLSALVNSKITLGNNPVS